MPKNFNSTKGDPQPSWQPTLRATLLALVIPLLLVGSGSILLWFFPGDPMALGLMLLAIVGANLAHTRINVLLITVIASICVALPHVVQNSLPSLVDTLWFACFWMAAVFLSWDPARLALTSAQLQSALHNAPIGLMVTDLDGKILSANAKMAQLWEQPQPLLEGRNLPDLLDHTLRDVVLEQREALASGSAVDLEFEVNDELENITYLAVHAKLAYNGIGKPGFYVIQISDLSEQLTAERNLQLASSQTREMLTTSSDLILATCDNWNITFANDAAKGILAAQDSQLIGQPIYNFIKLTDRKAFIRHLSKISPTQDNRMEEVRLVENPHLDLSVQVFAAEHNESGYLFVFRNAASQLATLREALARQSRLDQVFHGSPDGILLLRQSDDLILDFNDGFTRLLGYTREDAIGASLENRFWHSVGERDAVFNQLARDKEVFGFETALRTRESTLLHVELSLRFVEIDNELSVLMVFRDITKRISAEAALVETQEKFEKVFAESPDGIVIIKAADGTISDINDAMLRRGGFSRQDLLGRSANGDYKLIRTEDRTKIAKALSERGGFDNQEVEFYAKDGKSLPSLIAGTRLELAGESYVMLISKDISKQHATEERLRRSEQRFRGIFENAPIGIVLIDLDGRIFQANMTAAELLAYDAQHMGGLHISRLVPSEDRKILKQALMDLTPDRQAHKFECRMICQNGLEIWTTFNLVMQVDADNKPLYYIAQIADISDVKSSQQRMEQMAFYDTLTNLANRRLFHERLNQALEHSARTTCSSALLYLDLDNFKRVNDTLGHQVGDSLLTEVAQRLQRCVRKEDTVGRTGGDEFTILLNEIATPSDAGLVAQKILNHLREPIQVSGHPLIVTTSIGITVSPSDGLDPNELMRNADLAMYKAKERGKNNYQYYSDDLNTNAVKRLRTEYEIRQAILQEEFELFYQPKVQLATGRIVGVESLIRWNHPERGLLSPDEFIEVAEETGSIIDLGSWVIEHACGAAKVLSQANGASIQVAINISPRQFRDPNLINTVRRSIRESQLNPEQIEIEITETMLMHDVGAAELTVKRLSELGVKIAIDDFGTGYSSLNYLKRFPINTVKVDKSFVMDIPDNSDDMAITRAVIAMAHQLKMEVVAEGVETREQLAFLNEQNCEYAQGWLFSKALSEDSIVGLLQNNLGAVHLEEDHQTGG